MNRTRWYLHFIFRSLSQRIARVIVACSAVMIATAMIVSALGISLGIRMKLSNELKAYGANVIITPKGEYLGENVVEFLTPEIGVVDYSEQLYFTASVDKTTLEMIGLDFDWIKKQGWKVIGTWPNSNDILLGTNIRDALGVKEQDTIKIKFGQTTFNARVAGFVERGGPEDNSILMDIQRARELNNLQDKTSAIFVRAESSKVKSIVSELSKMIPNAEVKPLRQVAFAEESLLQKMELLMVLVTVVVVVASSISVSSTMSATILERIKEIGLMMAIGGTRKIIRGFYLFEGCAIGLIGGLLGYLFGFSAAQTVSKGAFGSFISVPIYVLPLSIITGVILSVLSSLVPIENAFSRRPSSVLRGE